MDSIVRRSEPVVPGSTVSLRTDVESTFGWPSRQGGSVSRWRTTTTSASARDRRSGTRTCGRGRLMAPRPPASSTQDSPCRRPRSMADYRAIAVVPTDQVAPTDLYGL